MVLIKTKTTEARLVRVAASKSLKLFVTEFWPVVVHEPLVWSWYHELQCDVLQEAYERVFRGEPYLHHLLWNVPPGTGKSTIHSVMPWPWGLTRMPHLRFLGASYSFGLASKLAMFSRDVIDSELYRAAFPEVKLRDDQNTKGFMCTTAGGERHAVGAGGAVMGTVHAHAIAIDDPIDPLQAQSDAETANINFWITNTLPSRKTDERITLVDMVGQRLKQGDATDEILRTTSRVAHYRLPADADYKIQPPELASNYVDGLLDPVRLGPDVLKEKKKKGKFYYAGQYGQDPRPAGGGMFLTEMIRWGRPPDRFKWVVRFWDKAATKEGKSRRAAYTAGVLLAGDFEGRVWGLNVVRGRWDTASRERKIERVALADSLRFGRLGFVIGLEEEGGSAGKDAIHFAKKRLRGYRVKVVRAASGGSKEVRAELFSQCVNEGDFRIPEAFRGGNDWVGWAKDYVEELSYWPHSEFLDQGDASGGAYTVGARGDVAIGTL